MQRLFDTPWKVTTELGRWLALPRVRLRFALSGIPWGEGWRIYGLPVVLRHRRSTMRFGQRLQLRGTLVSNPLGPSHPTILCTWLPGAELTIGDDFGMTGGTICAAERIVIGDRVTVGANSVIIDTDFHPLDPTERRRAPASARTASVTIEDDVFIGMHCLILKGVRLGRGCVVGAGSVVTHDVAAGIIVGGNPARPIGAVVRERVA